MLRQNFLLALKHNKMSSAYVRDFAFPFDIEWGYFVLLNSIFNKSAKDVSMGERVPCLMPLLALKVSVWSPFILTMNIGELIQASIHFMNSSGKFISFMLRVIAFHFNYALLKRISLLKEFWDFSPYLLILGVSYFSLVLANACNNGLN